MKKPQLSWLTVITFVVTAFTLGLFLGRNHIKSDINLSFPDSMDSPRRIETNHIQDLVPENSNVTFPIDINTADLYELTVLPGIGEGLGKEIIAYRENFGSFSHVEELMNVPGIGEKRLESIWDLITVGGS